MFSSNNKWIYQSGECYGDEYWRQLKLKTSEIELKVLSTVDVDLSTAISG